jgi:hypothetical protein
MKRVKQLSSMVILLTLVFAAGSRADTIYSNLGSGLSYGNSALRAATGSLNLAAATPFVVASGTNYNLTEIDLAIGQQNGPNPALVELTNNASGVPGTVIASWTMNFPGLFANSSIVPSQTITGISGITLDANTTYWLAVLPANAATDTWWYENNTGQTNIKASSFDGGVSWSSLYTQNANGAFAVFGDPQAVTETVPEPSAIWLLATGLLCIGGAIKKVLT